MEYLFNTSFLLKTKNSSFIVIQNFLSQLGIGATRGNFGEGGTRTNTMRVYFYGMRNIDNI